MPNRILRESICTSETLAHLTADEERLWYRLLVQVDDFGRFDGRPDVIRAHCYAMMLDKVKKGDVVRWLMGLARAGLVTIYEVDGRPYVAVCSWDKHNRPRANTSRYPSPHADADTCEHVHADADTCEHVHPYSYSYSYSYSDSDSDSKTPPTPPRGASERFAYPDEFERFWSTYPRKIEKRGAYQQWNARVKEGHTPDEIIMAGQNYAAYVRQVGTEQKFIKHPATFLGPAKPFEEYLTRDGPAPEPTREVLTAEKLRELKRRMAEEEVPYAANPP